MTDERNVQINIVVPDSFREHLKIEAAKQRRTMSEIVRQAIIDKYPIQKNQEIRNAIDQATADTRFAGDTA